MSWDCDWAGGVLGRGAEPNRPPPLELDVGAGIPNIGIEEPKLKGDDEAVAFVSFGICPPNKKLVGAEVAALGPKGGFTTGLS